MSVNARVPFGKHQGRTILEMAEHQPGYLNWILSLVGTAKSGFAAWGADHMDDINKALSKEELVEEPDDYVAHSDCIHRARTRFEEWVEEDAEEEGCLEEYH